jgi:uncharacterized protein
MSPVPAPPPADWRVAVARSFWRRLLGWMGRRIPECQGLLITPCSSVHTAFMRGAIDVVFLDANAQVLGVRTLRPWRAAVQRGACQVLELPAGGFAALGCGAVEQLVAQALQPIAPATATSFPSTTSSTVKVTPP